MLASSPASILNQTAPDLGIPFRFNPNELGSNSAISSSTNPWRARRVFKLAAGTILVAAILLVAGVIAIGLFLSAPARAIVGAAPADLAAEPVSIMSGSGATLRGWFVPGRPGAGAVVLLHSVHANRLAMLRRARLFNAEGFAVLLFDFQAQGESTGSRITFGIAKGRMRPPRSPTCGRVCRASASVRLALRSAVLRRCLRPNRSTSTRWCWNRSIRRSARLSKTA